MFDLFEIFKNKGLQKFRTIWYSQILMNYKYEFSTIMSQKYTCSEFMRVKIHDNASESSGLLLLSIRVIKNSSPKIQVPHNIGWSTRVVKINVLRKFTYASQLKRQN